MRSHVVFALSTAVFSLVHNPVLAQQAPPPTTDLDLNGAGMSMTLSGVKRYRNVCVRNGAVLTVGNYDGSNKLDSGNLELIAGSIYVDATSKIVARGSGYQGSLCSDGGGPNTTAGGKGGCSVMDSGGGGAHFGRGGRGTVDNPTSSTQVYQHGFPTAFEDDCDIDFVPGMSPTCAINNTSRTLCWQGWANRPTADPATCAVYPCEGNTVAGSQFWHNIYQPDFGAAGGDKGCRDGDGRSGNPMAGAGGGRIVLVALNERNPAAAASPCGTAQGTLQIDGTVDANGKRGCGVGNDSAGGGAGGTVMLVGKTVLVGANASVAAAGGLGGDTFGTSGTPEYEDCPSGAQYQGGSGVCDDCGGGGGGGIISVLSQQSTLNPDAAFNVSGALGGTCAVCKGEAGGGAGELQLDGAYVGEYCDGYDNDFDGAIDEGPNTQNCGLGTCQQSIAACTAGVPVSCSPMVDPDDVSCKAADNGARPRVAVILDTSASMLLDLAGYPTFGDGSMERPGIDTRTDGDSVANDSRLQLARESLAQVISAYPEIDFSLARYHQDQGINRSCQDAKWFECQGLVGTYDNPTGNTGTLNPACTVKIGPGSAPADSVTINPIPGPVGSQCINYAGSCGPPRRGADILSGFGSKVRDIVRWLDGKETNFSANMTSGDICQHSDGVHDCEVRGSGPTPLAGSLQAIEDYMAPIRATDAAAQCRGYSVILVTDGAESCNGQPASVAQHLHDTLGIEVYVIAVSVLASEQASLNDIAQKGSGNTRNATFVSMPQQLVPALTGIIAGAIRSEKCNSMDDDCDGKVDEDFPGIGVACDDGDKGVCKGEGTIGCNTAQTGTECKFTSSGGMSMAEACNSLDDDCDGKVDEGLDCEDTPCTPTGGEVCNGKDDDCNGEVDEYDPNVGHKCGEERGICMPGTQRCVAGMLRCVGGVMPGVEICNGKDDDCDGEADDDAPCPEGNSCIEGACRRACDQSVEFPCPVGYLCKAAPNSTGTYCLPGACALCKSTELCRDDKCVDPCDGVECGENSKCVLGNCKDCTQLGCPRGEVCFDGACQEDACRGVSCDDTQFCFKGECMALCDDSECPSGQRCNASGTCERDRCAGVVCDRGQVCRGGRCTADPCAEMSCTLGDVCVGELGCIADPCALTTCPRGAACTVGEQGLPACVSPSKAAPPPVRYIGGGGSGLTTCSVAWPGANTSQAAFWLVLPALIWGARRRRARRASRNEGVA